MRLSPSTRQPRRQMPLNDTPSMVTVPPSVGQVVGVGASNRSPGAPRLRLPPCDEIGRAWTEIRPAKRGRQVLGLYRRNHPMLSAVGGYGESFRTDDFAVGDPRRLDHPRRGYRVDGSPPSRFAA